MIEKHNSEVEELGWPTKTVLKEHTYISCLKENSTPTEPQKSTQADE